MTPLKTLCNPDTEDRMRRSGRSSALAIGIKGENPQPCLERRLAPTRSHCPVTVRQSFSEKLSGRRPCNNLFSRVLGAFGVPSVSRTMRESP